MSQSVDSCLTLVDLLHYRSHYFPNQIAYRFLIDGGLEDSSLTYQQLDREAKSIAAYLQSLNLYGSRVALIYPYEAGLEFIGAFFACLYAGAIAIPCHPPLRRHAFSDLQMRLIASGTEAVLTNKNLMNKVKAGLTLPEKTYWINTDNISQTGANDWVQPDIKPDSLAFLQYTSGSTGVPKGVITTHEGILSSQRMLKLSFGNTDKSIGVGWLPLFHDMGLIGNVIQALYVGGLSVLMSPMAFVQKPVRWLQAISRFQATISGAPNFAYELLCRHVTAEQKKDLDLSSWEVAFSGAEPIQVKTMEKFFEFFSPCGFRQNAFYSCYGMAESILLITGSEKAKPPIIKYISENDLGENRVFTSSKEKPGFYPIVGCGKTGLDRQIAIVDPYSLTRCEVNRVGEIWVAGSGLGVGYWNDPEQTQATFRAYTKDTNEGPFLRTGDLGFLLDSELFITGRLHDLMIFWGFNHYPQLLERTVESCHPALRPNCTAAFSVKIDGVERLVIVPEVERTYRQSLNVEEIAEVIRWTLFDKHFVDVYAIAFLKHGSIPKTSSGKIQRHACKDKYLDGSLDILGKWESPPNQPMDMTSVLRRYYNPRVHLRRYRLMMQSKIRNLFLKV